MEWIYQTDHDEQLAKLADQPLASELVEFLEANPNCILREIKAFFSDRKVEEVLEEMIQLKLVERQNRRYRLLLPILKELPTFNMNALLDQVLAIMGELSLAEQQALIVGDLWELLFVKNSRYCYGKEFTMDYWQRYELNSPGLAMVALNHGRSDSLPEYFYLQEKSRQLISPVHQQLAKLIGDVDVAYFLDQIDYYIKKLIKGKLKPQDNIFIDSLFLTGIAQESTAGAVINQKVITRSTPHLPGELVAAFQQLASTMTAESYQVFSQVFLTRLCGTMGLSEIIVIQLSDK